MSGIRSPADSPRPVKVERYNTPGPSSARFTGANWNSMPSTLRFEDAVVETVVTHVTRTTTSFPPLKLPSIPMPEAITLPTHLSRELYPLSHEPTPEEMKWFSMKVGDQRVVISEDGPVESPPTPAGDSRGWYRSLPPSTARGGEMSLVDVLNGARGKERKRTHQTFEPIQSETQYTPSESLENLASKVYPSPPRKRIRRPEETRTPIETAGAPLSPLPSPELESPPPAVSSPIPLGPGHELAALYSLPSMLTQFDGLPDQLQQHVLMHMLRRSRMPTIQRIATFASSAIRRDLIGSLPRELSVQILQYVDAKTLATSTRVCKKWRNIIDSERSVWKHRLMEDSLYVGKGVEEEEEAMLENRFKVLDKRQARERKWARQDAGLDEEMEEPPTMDRAVSLKHVYRRRHQDQDNWFNKRPVHNSFPGHGTNVITCLQFDREKIVCSSDDNAINVYNTSTGQLKKRLEGHAGGVWALQYRGDILVTGSTDRNVRVWDLEKMRATHTFNGHTSTVRCLQIVEPVLDGKTGKYFPPYPVIVTGSRDATMRVWKLPKKTENPVQKWGVDEHGEKKLLSVMPDENPYHIHALLGHTDAIRALACYGRYCVSGSYDTTVRLWDIVKGKCLHTLVGHEQKVYSIVYDRYRHRCASGSMDNTVKIWDLNTGTCLHTLMGHTSLVGLLGLSPNHLISAAADSSLRVWDADEMTIQHVLRNNGGAITCFRHDEHKVISGSDGMLKLWDIRRGKFVRDLIIGISSVWQVAVNGNLLVAASNRGGTTVFDIFDFGQLDHPSGVDNEELDNVDWEEIYPRDSIAVEMRKKGHYYDYELDDTILAKEQEEWDNERQLLHDNDEEEEDDEDDLVLGEDGNPLPWPMDRQPRHYTIQKPPRPIIIDARPVKKKAIRKSTRISGTSPKTHTPRHVLENFVNSGNKSSRGAKALNFTMGSPSAVAGSSKLPTRSLSKVLSTEKDKKGKSKAVNAVASGSGSGSTRNRIPAAINTRITRSRSGPTASPVRITRTSSAPSRKRSFAPVFDEEEDEEVEEALEGQDRADRIQGWKESRADRIQDWKESRLLRPKKELNMDEEEDELDSDPEEGEEEEKGDEDDDDMLGID